MEIASRMAFRAKGTTAPNPNVGAIIVKDGKIISEITMVFAQPFWLINVLKVLK